MKYDVLILAAGFGSRLKNLTKSKPKALIEFNNKKLIEIQLNSIDKKFINKVIVVIGYKSHLLVSFLRKKFPKINFQFVKNINYRINSSAQSFYYAYKKISTPVYIHLNCDCIFSKKHFLKLIQSNYKNMISVRSDIILKDNSENIEVDKDYIKKMSLNLRKKSKYRAYGVAKISKTEMLRNINLYLKLTNDEKIQMNYYSLIRQNLNYNFKIIKSDRLNLHEINSQDDKKKCKIIW